MLSVRCVQGDQTDKKIVTTLSGLALGSGTLSPDFASGTTAYTATTSVAKETITATATDDNDTVTITVNGDAIDSGDEAEWEEGENAVVVKVTDHGTPDVSTTYTVTVTYTDG